MSKAPLPEYCKSWVGFENYKSPFDTKYPVIDAHTTYTINEHVPRDDLAGYAERSRRMGSCSPHYMWVARYDRYAYSGKQEDLDEMLSFVTLDSPPAAKLPRHRQFNVSGNLFINIWEGLRFAIDQHPYFAVFCIIALVMLIGFG